MPVRAMDRRATAIPSRTKSSSFSKVGYASGVPGKLPNGPPEAYSTFPLALSTHSSSLSMHDGSPFCPRVASKAFSPTVAAQGLEIPRDLAKVKAIAAQFDMEITGPPLVVAGP